MLSDLPKARCSHRLGNRTKNSNPIRLSSAHYLDSWDSALPPPEIPAWCWTLYSLVQHPLFAKKPLDSERWGGGIDSHRFDQNCLKAEFSRPRIPAHSSQDDLLLFPTLSEERKDKVIVQMSVCVCVCVYAWFCT